MPRRPVLEELPALLLRPDPVLDLHGAVDGLGKRVEIPSCFRKSVHSPS